MTTADELICSNMTVTVAFDASPGVEQWVVNQSGGGLLGISLSDQSTHDSQSAAINAARRMANKGERIVLRRKSGGTRVIRQGN